MRLVQTRHLPSSRNRVGGTIIRSLPVAVRSASACIRVEAAMPAAPGPESAHIAVAGISGGLVATDGSVALFYAKNVSDPPIRSWPFIQDTCEGRI